MNVEGRGGFIMAKYVGYKDLKIPKTLKQLFVYLGHYKWMLILVAFLVFISAELMLQELILLNLLSIRFIVPGNMTGLLKAVIAMGVMYACGALSTLGYNRIMVKMSEGYTGYKEMIYLSIHRSFH